MSLCEALAWNTERIAFGTAIAPIYQRTIPDFAQSAALMHEVSGGRFRFGIGVAHGAVACAHGRRRRASRSATCAASSRSSAPQPGQGTLPPIIIAALRQKMVALAGEIAEGVVFANACALAHGSVAGRTAGGQAQRPGLLHRQHDPDLHQRRHRGGEGGEPAHADPATCSCRTTATTGRRRATWRRWRRSRRPSPKAAWTTCRST